MKPDAAQLHDVTVKHATDKALLCEIDGEDVWIPISQVDDDSEIDAQNRGPGTLIITRWIAQQKGLV